MLINIYNIFPSWLGINNVIELVLAIVCIVFLIIFYVLIGGGIICPKKLKNKWLRAIVIILWPIYVIGLFLSLPIIILADFSKPQDQQDKEFEEFMKEGNNEKER